MASSPARWWSAAAWSSCPAPRGRAHGPRVCDPAAGDIWTLDSLDPAAQPRKLDIQLTTPPTARAPKLITADDHLGDLDCDRTGQASVVTVRGTVHWLTHDDGPARGPPVDSAGRPRAPGGPGT